MPVEMESPIPSNVTTFTAILRGLARRYPACGDGPVLSGYLTQRPACETCGGDFSVISADDGPTWATLIVVGHVLAPLMVFVGRDERIPIWAAILLLSAAMLVSVWWVLPRAKGMFIALIWATGGTGADMKAFPTTANPEPEESGCN
tara:strand:- start:226 stop:666 length:441 start_codon:yes stop_codon:yes gene_type:complete